MLGSVTININIMEYKLLEDVISSNTTGSRMIGFIEIHTECYYQMISNYNKHWTSTVTEPWDKTPIKSLFKPFQLIILDIPLDTYYYLTFDDLV